MTSNLIYRVASRYLKAKNPDDFEHGLKVGDILYSDYAVATQLGTSGNAERFNWAWYQVVKAKPESKSVIINQISSKIIPDSNGFSEIPVSGDSLRNSTPNVKTPQYSPFDGVYIKLSNYSRAYPWNGKPRKHTEGKVGNFTRESRNPKDFVHGLKVGDILTSSWGYDQTNVYWYQVTGAKPESKAVIIRRIESKVVSGQGGPSEKVVPIPGRFKGEPMKKIPQQGYKGDALIKISSYELATLWDGSPQYQTGGSYGH